MHKAPAETLIYVVDNESVIASTAAMVLRSQGYQAASFTDPTDALDAAKTQAPDLLLADMLMPSISGTDLALRLVEIHPDCKILLFSGLADPQHLLAGVKSAGHSFEYLAKPADPVTLLARIQKILA